MVLTRTRAGGVAAWVADHDDRLRFMLTNDEKIKDRATSSLWDLDLGRCVEGSLEGVQLDALPVTDVFWFAWSSFYPNTEVVD